MPYVMVPVPEEHVVDVMQYVARLASRATRQTWDKESIEQLFLEASEPVRSLLSVVASATLADKEISAGEALRALELRPRALSSLLGPVREAAREANREPLIELQQVQRTGPAGRTRAVRNMIMDREAAEMIRSAELKALEVEPHPLDREAG